MHDELLETGATSSMKHRRELRKVRPSPDDVEDSH
jgi:hypothetical protein